MTTTDFDKIIWRDALTFVDFFATWCGPCQMMGPVVEEISNEVTDAKVCKVNIDEEMAIAQKYGVMSIPTFVVIKNGEVTARDMGAKPKSAVLEMLK